MGKILDDDEIGSILVPFHSKWNTTFFGTPVMSEEDVCKVVEAAYKKALQDNDILYGDDAEKLIDEVFNPPPITKKQQEFLDQYIDVYKKINQNNV